MIKNLLYIVMALMWVTLLANIVYIHHPSLGKLALVVCIVLYIVLNRMETHTEVRSDYDGSN